jgi:AcrR family transcriptional regulator
MATVEAIYEATIQVLRRDGGDKLTTTRVATRAGVSVGTLYQYFPDKRALLSSLLERHLRGVLESLEQVFAARRGAALHEMVGAVCDAFLEAKLRRLDVSIALYAISAQAGGDVLAREMSRRGAAGLAALLASARDADFDDLAIPSTVLVSAMAGAVQAAMEARVDPATWRELREHLVAMSLGYLDRLRRAPNADGSVHATP